MRSFGHRELNVADRAASKRSDLDGLPDSAIRQQIQQVVGLLGRVSVEIQEHITHDQARRFGGAGWGDADNQQSALASLGPLRRCERRRLHRQANESTARRAGGEDLSRRRPRD